MTISESIPNPTTDELSVAFLIGQSIVGIEREGSPQCLFQFNSAVTLSAESLWRIVAGGRVFVSSEDHQQKFGLPAPIDAPALAMGAIGNSPVRNAAVAGDTGDLRLEFDNGSRLECIVDSCGYENWQIFKGNSEMLIARGGGELSLYAPRRAGAKAPDSDAS